MLPYKGLGSGIKRAVAAWKDIEFIDDRDGCLFSAVVRRGVGENAVNVGEKFGVSEKVTAEMSGNFLVTIPELAKKLGIAERTVERHIRLLQEQGKIRRVGPAKGGHWEVLES